MNGKYLSFGVLWEYVFLIAQWRTKWESFGENVVMQLGNKWFFRHTIRCALSLGCINCWFFVVPTLFSFPFHSIENRISFDKECFHWIHQQHSILFIAHFRQERLFKIQRFCSDEQYDNHWLDRLVIYQ